MSVDFDGQAPGYGLERLMSQRREILHAKTEMLNSEIYQRRRLKEVNLYRICLDQCSCRTVIYEIGDHLWDNKRMALEQKIIDLEEEKRREETTYFRDIQFLRKELRESLIEKMEDQQKAELLTDHEEELACKPQRETMLKSSQRIL
jgi:hypothetical protein